METSNSAASSTAKMNTFVKVEAGNEVGYEFTMPGYNLTITIDVLCYKPGKIIIGVRPLIYIN